MSVVTQADGSLARRLFICLVGSAVLLALIMFFIVQKFARQVAEESQDNILTASATSILDSVSTQAHEVSVDIPYAALSMLGTVGNDRVFYQVLADQRHITGYEDLPGGVVGREGYGVTTVRYKNESIRLVQMSREQSLAGKSVPIVVKVAQTQSIHTSRVSSIIRSMLLPAIGLFSLAVFLAILSARATIRPLKQLAVSVSRRGPDDLRPVTSPVPLELEPLVSSLNLFIGRLKRTLSQSEDLITEAAHRLRTPLATVRAQAEVALMRVERPENRQSLKTMIRAIEETSRAANQLLDHAMVSFRSEQLTQQETSLGDLVFDVVARLRPIADLKDIDVRIDIEQSVLIKGDAILIQSAIRNVIENAIKYSPEDNFIDVTLERQSDTCYLCIIDNGGGFPENSADRLTERFARGDNVKDTTGSGLGLTIAKEVATAHGGTLQIENRNNSGACVCLCFPVLT
ncbi:ATPase [Chromatiales bacterium (ex Bugula neritina AB1)]|nr:ATPase [Chromatiales bacterium (ex Bugula neritina AB1)]